MGVTAKRDEGEGNGAIKMVDEGDNEILFFFFFQAEDGIRDIGVTGVQTCALPISDIIFFWVARMIMAGYEYKQAMPFKHVYFTGIVRDKLGRKMSKSLGNSPDPIELIEKYGADGVRMGMMLAAPAGNDILFDEALCEQGRNFNNKIWNAFRLVQGWEVAELEQSETNKI